MADRTKAEPLLDRHVEIYESMTETLIFGKNKFDRIYCMGHYCLAMLEKYGCPL